MDSELYTALVKGDIDVLKGKDWLQVRDQLTPANNSVLHLACQYGNIECVEEILQHADESLILQTNSRGETALHLAARQRRNYDTVEALINKAKSLDLDNTASKILQNLIRARNVEFETALHSAARYYHDKVAEVLLKADPSFSYPRNKYNKTPIYLAAAGGASYVLQTFLENCESPTFGGPHGRTALHATLMREYESGILKCTKLLLRKNEDLVNVADANGWTVFHYAAYNNLVTILEFLLSVNKFMAYAADRKYKRTPLHVAAYKGHCNVLKELLKYLPDAWESVDGNGQNIFHIAVNQQQNSVIGYILSEKMMKKSLSIQRDNEGNTPFHLIARFGYYFPELREWTQPVYWNSADDTNLTPSEVLYQNNKDSIINEEELVGESLNRSLVRRNLLRWVFLEGPKQGVLAETPKEMIKRYRQMANSHMIVAALITTVALTAGFAVPGGFDGNQGPNQGSPVLLRKKAFKTFVVADTFALLFSISSLFLYFLTSFKLSTEVIFNFLITAILLNVVSIAAMMVAFIAGTYAVLSRLKVLAIIVCIISSIFLLLVFYFCFIPVRRLLRRMLRRKLKKMYRVELSKELWNV